MYLCEGLCVCACVCGVCVCVCVCVCAFRLALHVGLRGFDVCVFQMVILDFYGVLVLMREGLVPSGVFV